MQGKRSKTEIKKYIRDVANGDTSFILDAITKAFKDEAQLLREEEEKEVEEEKEKLEKIMSYDNNRQAYFEKNRFGETEKLKAYLVRFVDHPEYLYIAFALTADKARAQAQRYIRDTFYPFHTINGCPVSLYETRTKRMPSLDEFKHTGKIPIPNLLKAGMTLKCGACGKYEFDYSDYKAKRCFIVEGEGDLNPYTNGYIFCHDCYNKYFN